MPNPENTIRQIVARKNPFKGTDKNLEGAIKFILQQQKKDNITRADMSAVSGAEHDTNQLMRRIHGSLVAEAKDPDQSELDQTATKLSSKEGLANLVATALNRYSFLKDSEDRGILLLMAALMLLNVSDGGENTNATARRLITAGLMHVKRKKNDK
jgi:hypothetical protein